MNDELYQTSITEESRNKNILRFFKDKTTRDNRYPVFNFHVKEVMGTDNYLKEHAKIIEREWVDIPPSKSLAGLTYIYTTFDDEETYEDYVYRHLFIKLLDGSKLIISIKVNKESKKAEAYYLSHCGNFDSLNEFLF